MRVKLPRRATHLPDSPVVVVAVLLLVALVFVLARVELAGDGSIGRFVVAGSDYARPPLPGVPVEPGDGYDGQFAYRLAVNPSNLHTSAYGVRLDTPLRLERITYPALAWVASAGHRGALPVALVVVNVLALLVLGWLAGRLAQQCGRHAAWGLLLAGYWGYLFSLGRDLHEIVTGCFVLAGLLAWRSRRWPAAALLLSAAVLARETALLVVVAIAVVRLVELARRRARPGQLDLAWAVPVVVFAGWQLVCAVVNGSLPVAAGGPAQVGVPVVALVGAIGSTIGDLGGASPRSAALLLVQIAVLAFVVGTAAAALRHTKARLDERIAWGLAVLLTLSLSRHYWQGPEDLRALSDVYLLSALLLLAAPRVLRLAAAGVAVAFLATFVTRVMLI